MKNKNKIILLAIYLILMISLVFLGIQSFRYDLLYKEAIKQGAENTIMALQMVTACQMLSNVTSDEIRDQVIRTFILGEDWVRNSSGGSK